MRRQVPFMRQIVQRRLELGTHAIVEAGVESYRQFLSLMRHSDLSGPGLVPPNAIVDLIWHTHQQWPARYARECLRIVGHEIDHDDDAQGEEKQKELDEGAQRTRHAYAAAFGHARL
jgi:hypothetical protein